MNMFKGQHYNRMTPRMRQGRTRKKFGYRARGIRAHMHVPSDKASAASVGARIFHKMKHTAGDALL